MPRVDGERETWEQVRDDYRKAQAYFHDNPRELSLVGALGFGGNGLVIKCEYRRNMLAPVLTFVMKIALYRWDAPELYEEEITTEVGSLVACIIAGYELIPCYLPEFQSRGAHCADNSPVQGRHASARTPCLAPKPRLG